MSALKILIADDDIAILNSYKLNFSDLDVVYVSDGDQAIEAMKKDFFHVVITDFNMPKVKGIDVIRFKNTNHPEAFGILVSGQIDTPMAMELGNMRSSMFDKAKTDISDIKDKAIALYNEYLKNQETLRNSLAGKISAQYMHDIANHMAGISLSAQLAIKTENSASTTSRLDKIIKKSDEFTHTTNYFKSKISGFSNLSLSEVFLTEFVDNIREDLKAICEKDGFEYQEELIDVSEIDYITVQSMLLKNAILNLFSNSIHANKKSEAKKWIKLKVSSEMGKARIEVMDCGPRLPESISDKLFKEQFTTKGSEGTGQGLMYSKASIENFFGKIEYNKHCDNCCFVISLAVSKAESQGSDDSVDDGNSQKVA